MHPPSKPEQKSEPDGETLEDIDLSAHAERIRPTMRGQFRDREMQRVTERDDPEQTRGAALEIDRLARGGAPLDPLHKTGDKKERRRDETVGVIEQREPAALAQPGGEKGIYDVRLDHHEHRRAPEKIQPCQARAPARGRSVRGNLGGTADGYGTVQNLDDWD